MFGLGKDAGPCLEEGTGVGDGVGKGLVFVIEYAGSMFSSEEMVEKRSSYIHVPSSFL